MMRARWLFRIVFSILFIFGLLGTAQAETLYGITWDSGVPGGMLITIDTTTGAGTPVGPLSSGMAAYGLGTRASKLYTFDQIADVIRELDPATGATVNTIDVGLALVGEGAVAFRDDGIGFLADCAEGDLYSFDITGPSSTFIGSHGPVCMDGMDFSPGGVLYGLSQSFPSPGPPAFLYTIDQSTGATTLVGDTGGTDTTGPVSGLAFRSDGVLFGEIADGLWTIDVSTGAATHVGPIGFSISGLTFLDVVAVPEPAGAVLLTLGLLAVMVMTRRQIAGSVPT